MYETCSSDLMLTFCPHVTDMVVEYACTGDNASRISGSPTYVLRTMHTCNC